MNGFYILVTIAAGLWLVSLICTGLSIALGWHAAARRFWASIVLAIATLVIGCMGLRLHITYSQTVNGHGWSIDSKWFFVATLILGALALALALWNRMRRKPLPAA
jgi:hypothetical protein